MNEDLLYTPEEIAQKLKLTKGTIYEMIKRGELEAHRIGRAIRISKTQFELYLLKAKGYDNTYEATIIKENDETFARVDGVKIYVDTPLEGQVKLSIRPENILLSREAFLSSARNNYKGTVTDIVHTGNKILVTVNMGIPIHVFITARSLEEMAIEQGCEVYVVFKAMSVMVYK